MLFFNVGTPVGSDGYYYTMFYRSDINRQVDDKTVAYVAYNSDNLLYMSTISDGIILAGQTVILKRKDKGNITLTAVFKDPDNPIRYESNQLKGVDEATAVSSLLGDGETIYVQDRVNGHVGLYKYSGDMLDARKAYLPLSENSASGYLFDSGSAIIDLNLDVSEDNSSKINSNNKRVSDVTLKGRTLYRDGGWNLLCLPFDLGPAADTQPLRQGWYTPDGRKLGSKPTAKGLYIHNGKKVVINPKR